MTLIFCWFRYRSSNARFQLDEKPPTSSSNNLERSTLKTTTSAEPEYEYEYYYEYIYEDDLPEFKENLPPSTTLETTFPTKQTLMTESTSSKFIEPPLTASNGEKKTKIIWNSQDKKKLLSQYIQMYVK